ncbi:MAG: hypothetical protein KIS91_18395 [Anaerolineae bacterium]|nr:hypothetical protein [Anaerolineae bacterium]
MKRLRLVLLPALLLVLALVAFPAAPVGAANCTFVLGFKTLHDLIPGIVGNCVTDEYHDGVGNGYQQTVNGLMQWRKSDNWTAFTNGYQTWVNGPFGVRQRLNTQRFAWEANREGLPVVPGSGTPPSLYYDDRSNAEALMLSWVNALNQKQYLRAYSYWEPGAAGLPPFPQFEQGYQNTATTQISFGQMTEDAGAGQFYTNVPVILTSQLTNGTFQTFVGCYTLHLANPGIQGVPFQSLGIRSANVQQVAAGQDPSALLGAICAPAGSPVAPLPVYAPGDISATRYLDDRSDGVQVLRSLFNAVNRKEYARAYGYWEPGAIGLPPFPQFEQGYQNTQSVQLTTGAVKTDVGAGQTYYRVPVTLVAQTTGGQQTFVGCYVLHLGSPYAQATPPYQPIGIRQAKLTQVANGTNTAPLMATACQGLP